MWSRRFLFWIITRLIIIEFLALYNSENIIPDYLQSDGIRYPEGFYVAWPDTMDCIDTGTQFSANTSDNDHCIPQLIPLEFYPNSNLLPFLSNILPRKIPKVPKTFWFWGLLGAAGQYSNCRPHPYQGCWKTSNPLKKFNKTQHKIRDLNCRLQGF